jgi:YidC/Oxa1 family membrane protein insertase
MMKFYKENSINPLGGCLPLLAQTPIFIALYEMLRKIQNFIPQTGSLSQMYTDICSGLHCKTVNLDFFGMNLQTSAGQAPKGFGNALPYYVLVGLVVISAFFQQRQTMRTQTQANPQMQIIGKVMPVIFGFISINIPAGVVLYFLTSNIWQIGQQELVFRTIGTAAGPPKGKAAKLDKGGGEPPAIEAKSTESPGPAPASGGVKGLFRSLSPSSGATEDAAPSGNGKPAPSTGAKGSAAKSQPAKPGTKSSATKPATKSSGAKPSSSATKKTGSTAGSGSGTSSGSGSSSNARRKNNRKRKR